MFFIALNILIQLADLLAIALLVVVVSYYSSSGGVAAQVFHWLSMGQAGQGVLWVFVFFAAFVLIKNSGAIFFQHRQFRFVYDVAARISRMGLQNYLNGTFKSYTDSGSSVFIRKISHLPLEFAQYVLFGFQQLLAEGVLVGITVSLILVFNSGISLVLLVTLPVPVAAIVFFTKRRLVSIRGHIQKANQQSLQYLQEALQGFVEANIYDKKDYFTDRYLVPQNRLNKYLADLHSVQASTQRLAETLAIMGLLLLLVSNLCWHIFPGNLVFDLGLFLGASYKIVPGLVRIVNLTAQLRTFAYSADELSLSNVEQTKQPENQNVSPKISHIKFQNVQYALGDKILLQNRSFDLQAGELVGLSGKSGKGKTTIINLLLGFISETGGEVFINGQKTLPAERAKYWPAISYVKQQTFIFNESIEKNITFSPNAAQEGRLSELASFTDMYGFIHTFSEGFGKQVAEDGKNISGGQRQRIAMARALYKKSDVYIFDEPFSELDTAAEQFLTGQMKKVAESGAIVIFISHNQQSLSHCHKIIALDD